MKKIVYLSGIMSLLLLSMNASAKNIVHNSKNKSFHHVFHHAKNVHRFDDKNGVVEYDFMLKGKYVSAFYTQAGTLFETDFSIAYKQLPTATQSIIKEKFSNPVITDIVKVTHKQNFFYRIKLEANGNEYSILASPTGELTVGY
ncbi:MAG TPA: hypothetical protein VNW06_00670 [Cytophagaceae bacterium]|jgi:hypothetical protein|nr:hypothetical protein [Cytophagaceae bacterium]